jgi:hypothetical protein
LSTPVRDCTRYRIDAQRTQRYIDEEPLRNPAMSLRPWRDITRRKCRQIMVGNVPVGGDAPVTVQTMAPSSFGK